MKRLFQLAFTTFFVLASAHSIQAGKMENFGIIDVKNHQISSLPKLRGNGTTDETAALQQLANYAYKNRMALVFPEGSYLVSDTITLIQDEESQRKDTGNVWFGSTTGTRPEIVLKNNAPGFNNSNNPKAVLRIIATCDPSQRGCPYPENDRASNFQQGIKNINVRLGSGNGGAVGISFPGSQDSFLEDITIYAQGGFAGFSATPGLGVVTGNLEVRGGKYGIYMTENTPSSNNGTTFTNVKFINQETAAIANLRPSEKPVTFVGIVIEKPVSPAIELIPGTDGNQVTFIDTYIDIERDSTTPVVINDGTSNVSFFNTYVKNGSKFIKNGSSVTNGNGTSYLVKEYSFINSISRYVLNGTERNGPHEYKVFTNSTLLKDQLTQRHSFCVHELSPDHLVNLGEQNNSGVCNVVERGADPTGQTNASVILQEAVNDPACSTVFLPKGEYRLTQTLRITREVQLRGLASHLTRIRANRAGSNSMDSWKPTNNVGLIEFDTGNDPVTFSFIRLQKPMNPSSNAWFSNFVWKSGKNYVIKNVSIRSMYDTGQRHPVSDVLIFGDVTGKWFGAKSAGSGGENSSNTHALKRKMSIENTTGPLALYNLNIEDGWAYYADNQNGGQMDVKNSQNVVIFGAKSEDKRAFRFFSSSNTAGFSFGKAEMEIRNSNDVVISSFDFFNGAFFKEDGNIITNGDDRNQSNSVPSIGLFKRGAFDYDAFANQLDTVCAAYGSNPPPTPDPTPDPTPPPTPDPTPNPNEWCDWPLDLRVNINRDSENRVDIFDYNTLVSQFGTSTNESDPFVYSDINCSGAVDIFDYNLFVGAFTASN